MKVPKIISKEIELMGLSGKMVDKEIILKELSKRIMDREIHKMD